MRGILSATFVIWCLAFILRVPYYFNIYFSIPQFLAIGLIFLLFLHFLSSKRSKRWIDALPVLFGIPGAAYIALFYNQALDAYEGYGFLDVKGTVLVFSLAIAILIIVWRRTGLAMPIIITFLTLLVRLQKYLPDVLYGPGYDLGSLGYSFYIGTHGIFGVPFKIACTVLVPFILFGILFDATGGGKWFLKIAARLLGSMRGGIASTSVLASAFFGMISGSPSANTASTGSITIPAMIRSGYSPALAGAIEATASTGGQFTPPVMGAIIFIMAEWLSIPYWQIVKMAAIPAFLFYTVVFSSIYFEALKSKRSTTKSSETTQFSMLLKEGWIYIFPLIGLIFFLLILKYEPGEAVIFSVLILIVCSFMSGDKKRRLYPNRIYQTIVKGVDSWLTVGAVTSAVGMVIGALALSGLGIKFSAFLINTSGGYLIPLLVLVGLSSFILGMGMDSIPCYITVAILTAPALVKVGVPDYAAHLFVIYWGMSAFITPPICMAVYVACGISGAGIWETGIRAVKIGIGVFVVPIAFVLWPALLLNGSIYEIMVSAFIAGIVAMGIGSALSGYCLKRLNFLQSLLLLIGPIMIISGAQNRIVFIIGLILMLASVVWQLLEWHGKHFSS